MSKQDLSSEEKKFIEYQTGSCGSFQTSLYDTWFKADSQNSKKLEAVFPELEICRKFRDETGYWEDLCKRWNKSKTQTNG